MTTEWDSWFRKDTRRDLFSIAELPGTIRVIGANGEPIGEEGFGRLGNAKHKLFNILKIVKENGLVFGKKRITLEDGTVVFLREVEGMTKIDIVVPTGVRKRRKFIEEVEDGNTYPVPIFEVFSDATHLVSMIGCDIDFAPIAYSSLKTPALLESSGFDDNHERIVLESEQPDGEPFYAFTAKNSRPQLEAMAKSVPWLGREESEMVEEINQLVKIGKCPNRFQYLSNSTSNSETTGWVETIIAPYPSDPWITQQEATYHAVSTYNANHYIDYDASGEEVIGLGPVVLVEATSDDWTSTARVWDYAISGPPVDTWRIEWGWVTAIRTGIHFSILSSNAVKNHEKYADYSRYCFIFEEWPNSPSGSDSSYPGDDHSPWTIYSGPDGEQAGQTIGLGVNFPYNIYTYFRTWGGSQGEQTFFLFKREFDTNASQRGYVGSWFCDIYDFYGEPVFLYSWGEYTYSTVTFTYTYLKMHYGMVYKDRHYTSEDFDTFAPASWLHKFEGNFRYPDQVAPFYGYGFLRVGEYSGGKKYLKEIMP